MSVNNIRRLVLVGVLFIQPWFWQISSSNLPLVVLLTLLGLLLTFTEKWAFGLLVVLILGIFFWQMATIADKELLVVTEHDIIRLNKQRSAFPGSIGRFFVNKPLFIWQKVERNLSYNLDPNMLFFSSHPRERGGILEQPRLINFLLPFFLFGIFLVCQGKYKRVFWYGLLAVVFSTFIIPSSPLGPVLLFPLGCYLISLGIYQTLVLVLKLKR